MENKLKVIILIVIIAIMPIIPSYAETRNNNPLLKQLIIDGEELNEFEQFTTEYVFATEKEEVKIKAIPEDENANVEVIGNTKLEYGVNNIEVKVTAEDKKTIQSYYLHITRGNPAKSNAKLKTLEIQNLELNPNFSTNELNYFVEYKGNFENLKLNAVPESNEATVNITKTFSEEDVVFKIEVIAEDKITKKTYTITATKVENNEEIDEKQEEREIKNEEIQEVNNNEVKANNIVKYCLLILIIIIIFVIIFFIRIIKRKNWKKRF